LLNGKNSTGSAAGSRSRTPRAAKNQFRPRLWPTRRNACTPPRSGACRVTRFASFTTRFVISTGNHGTPTSCVDSCGPAGARHQVVATSRPDNCRLDQPATLSPKTAIDAIYRAQFPDLRFERYARAMNLEAWRRERLADADVPSSTMERAARQRSARGGCARARGALCVHDTHYRVVLDAPTAGSSDPTGST